MNDTPKALIAMSGGVDSSVAAYLTLQQGLQGIGGTMRLHASSGCASLDDVKDAQAVARRLGMEFFVFSAEDFFRRDVMDSFVDSYESGLTPNPCIECNRKLKFGFLLDKALKLGCDTVVTGHYARIRQDADTGRYLLCKALDESKDQSYFLACLNQHQLAHIRFPLGELTKPQVRQIAEELGFGNAKKRDSQDICFVPDGDYLAFLERYTGKTYPQGDFLDAKGNVVGKHKGAVAYTIGQRKGLGLAMGEPVYVCHKDMEKNTVTVSSNSSLFHRALIADDWYWHPFPALTAPMRVKAKARSRMVEQPATVYPEENGVVRVVFDEPQRAITPGQAIVLYDGDIVVGGGTIRQVMPDSLSIRKATDADLPAIEAIYADAREFMRQNGNPHQWGDSYPETDIITRDLELGQLYVCTDGNAIIGVFCFFQGLEPCYGHIEGQWCKEGESGVMHRLAVTAHRKGVAAFCFDYAFSQCQNIKIDTHRDNLPMQKALEKNGFLPCGVIYLENGEQRLAYQRC